MKCFVVTLAFAYRVILSGVKRSGTKSKNPVDDGVPRLRCAPFGMTLLLNSKTFGARTANCLNQQVVLVWKNCAQIDFEAVICNMTDQRWSRVTQTHRQIEWRTILRNH